MATNSITATIPRIPEIPSPKERRISGARTLKAVLSSSSTALSPNSTTSGKSGAPSVSPSVSRVARRAHRLPNQPDSSSSDRNAVEVPKEAKGYWTGRSDHRRIYTPLTFQEALPAARSRR